MSIQKNINNNLNDSFKNTNYLPQKLLLEDVDRGMRDFIIDLGITVEASYFLDSRKMGRI